jgi:hypothetical protein
MDGKLWKQVYRMVMSIAQPKPRRKPRYSDQWIVLILLRAAADNLSIHRVCHSQHWIGLAHVATLPSQPTVSRRSRTASVQQLLSQAEQWLRQQPIDERVAAIDGRALTVNAHSKDPDARWGYAGRGFAKGYKLHAIWDTAPMPRAWEIRPLNQAESVVAATTLVPRLSPTRHKRYLVGDPALDSNQLCAVAAQHGYQMLAPPKRRGQHLGHRAHHPARVTGLALLTTRYGRRLYRRRGMIERQFGNSSMRPEGLGHLPAHVRRLPRVIRFVQSKLILNAFCILLNKNILR